MKLPALKIIPLLLLTASLSACLSNKPYQRELDSWIGRNLAELKELWGDSKESFEAQNGNVVYVWEQSATYKLHAQSRPRYSQLGDERLRSTINVAREEYTFWCRIQFEVDADLVVISWEYKGNNCRKREGSPLEATIQNSQFGNRNS